LAMFPGNAVANALTAINASVGARSIDALLAQDQEAEQQQNRRGESKDEHDALPPPPQNDFAPARFSAG
jgi:hypothetical protein